jgi:hypothetical protein
VEVAPSGAGRLEQRTRGVLNPADTYTLVTPEGRNIQVSRYKGAWLVADAVDHAMHLRRNMPPERITRVYAKGAFQPTGPERVGRWAGTLYRLALGRWEFEELSEFVLMKSSEYAPVGRVLGANYADALRAWPIDPPMYKRQMSELFATGLPLRIGDATLKTLTTRKTEPSRFRAPARPLSRQELFDLFDSDAPKIAPRPRPIRN